VQMTFNVAQRDIVNLELLKSIARMEYITSSLAIIVRSLITSYRFLKSFLSFLHRKRKTFLCSSKLHF
jgi:hypothetical protein